MIHRYTLHRSPLKDFLTTRLQGARRSFYTLMAHLEEKYYVGLLSAARVLGELVKDQRLG